MNESTIYYFQTILSFKSHSVAFLKYRSDIFNEY